LTAENWAADAPEAMVTEDGIETAALLVLRATEVAAVAAPLSDTVQVLLPGPVMEVGLQTSELNVGAWGRLTTPPVPDTD
jgi:hypothetical protein